MSVCLSVCAWELSTLLVGWSVGQLTDIIVVVVVSGRRIPFGWESAEGYEEEEEDELEGVRKRGSRKVR